MQQALQRVAVVTGAAGAISREVSRVFKGANWRLALFERSPEKVEALQETHPKALVVRVDLTDGTATERAVGMVVEHFGQLDTVLNIAGGFAMQSAGEASLEDLEGQLSINLKTLFNTTRAALPHMLERGEGFLLGVSAGAALTGGARMPAYAASKGAVASFLKAVRAEVEPQGVGVSVLYPMGTVDTPANREAMPQADPQGWISAGEVAESILFLATRSKRGRVRELQVFPPGAR